MAENININRLTQEANSRRAFIKKTGLTALMLATGIPGWSNTPACIGNWPAVSQLGASTACLAGLTIQEALQELNRLGFSNVEIITYTGARHSVGNIPGFSLHNATNKERQLVYGATRSFSHISAHLPFTDLHPFSSDPDVRGFSVQQLRRGIDTLAFLKGELAVIHPGWPAPGQTYKDIWKLMLDTFRGLGDYAAKKGIKIGLETMQPASINEFSQLIFEINHPFVGATIDTGHIRGSSDINLPDARKYTKEGIERFTEVLLKLANTLGDKVLHYHLTDVRSNDWRDHQTIGTGIIDFDKLFRLLKQQEYKGLLVLELEEPDKLNALLTSKANIEKIIQS